MEPKPPPCHHFFNVRIHIYPFLVKILNNEIVPHLRVYDHRSNIFFHIKVDQALNNTSISQLCLHKCALEILLPSGKFHQSTSEHFGTDFFELLVISLSNLCQQQQHLFQCMNRRLFVLRSDTSSGEGSASTPRECKQQNGNVHCEIFSMYILICQLYFYFSNLMGRLNFK